MNMGRRLLTVGFVGAAMLSALAVPASADVTIIQLKSLGGSASGAWGVNSSGVAVGWSNTTGDTTSHAVRWAPDGTATDLGTLPGDTGSGATAINNSGAIVGRSSKPPFQRAVKWAPDGAITALPPTSTKSYCEAKAINASGAAVGHCTSNLSAGDYQAVRWNADGSVAVLATKPGDQWGEALGINSAGVIVGSLYSTTTGTRAVRWNVDGTVTELAAVPGAYYAQARGINDSGQITGRVQRNMGSEPVVHAVRWNTDGTATILNAVPGVTDESSGANAINSGGLIAGETTNTAGRIVGALWTPDGTVTTLPTLPGLPAGTIDFATTVNIRGVVVGSAGGNAVRWNQTGRVLVPIRCTTPPFCSP